MASYQTAPMRPEHVATEVAAVASRTVLPNLVMIGAMKSATSSLHYYLDLHPEITMVKDKELDFFIERKNWGKGISWYSSMFTGRARIEGESSPNYTKYPTFDGVPELMHSVLPEAKLIYIVRDPISRIVSQYVHNYQLGRDNRTIDQALKEPERSSYVHCSKYYMQLERYLRFYDAASILILSTEELQKQRQATMQKVFRFLDVDDTFYSPEYERIIHQSAEKRRNNRLGRFLNRVVSHSKVKPWVPGAFVRAVDGYNARTARKVEKPVLATQTRQRLVDHLKDDVARLRAHTGNSFPDWRL